ncbi:hypothetical protein PVAP13_2KG375621 [Panicum virgatum]|uniref:Replication protein A OB domain-containing protein n=1 Tax=Panicum virgatum TaxID=38727 RepID=A0A8T0WBQ6_PANVG|nr:hypothetical protein PVAP13_2KG375621 [Panicum virgatum]
MPIEGPYMLELTCHTKINPTTSTATFPNYIYKLTPFQDLPPYIGDTKKFLDVIGILIQVAEPEWVFFSNQKKPNLRRDLLIKDENGLELKVALWGQKARQFNINTINSETESATIVILFVGCLMKIYQGQPYLGGHSACHWYFNPNIPEAQMLQNRKVAVSAQ